MAEYAPPTHITRSNLKSEYDRVVAINDALQTRLAQLSSLEDQNRGLIEQLERQTGSTLRAQTLQDRLRGELLAAQAEIERVRRDLIDRQQECNNISAQVGDLSETLADRLEEYEAGAENWRAQVNELRRQLDVMTQNAIAEQRKKTECRQELEALRNRVSSMGISL